MAERGALQLVLNRVREVFEQRERTEQAAQKSAGTTSATHLISELRKEIEKVFQEALAE